MNILAIDPGKLKCGLAVAQNQQLILLKMILPIDELSVKVEELVEEFQITLIVIGDRTQSNIICKSLQNLKIPIVKVNEDYSSLEGRRRYLRDHRDGLSRFIPIGLRVPKEPYDDYVAVVLAERYFASLH